MTHRFLSLFLIGCMTTSANALDLSKQKPSDNVIDQTSFYTWECHATNSRRQSDLWRCEYTPNALLVAQQIIPDYTAICRNFRDKVYSPYCTIK